jgi:hypothetical protein
MNAEKQIPKCCNSEMAPIMRALSNIRDGWFCYTCAQWINTADEKLNVSISLDNI